MFKSTGECGDHGDRVISDHMENIQRELPTSGGDLRWYCSPVHHFRF